MTKTEKIVIDFEKVTDVVTALEDYSEQFGTSHKNRPIEKQYFKQFIEYYPNQKSDLINLYTDLKDEHWYNLEPNEQIEPNEIQFHNDMTDLIEYFKTF